MDFPPAAAITSIEYHLPEDTLTNQQLDAEHPEWNMAKNESKTGIVQRHISAEEECSSDLGVAAAEKLWDKYAVASRELEAERAQTLAELNGFLDELGYLR